MTEQELHAEMQACLDAMKPYQDRYADLKAQLAALQKQRIISEHNLVIGEVRRCGWESDTKGWGEFQHNEKLRLRGAYFMEVKRKKFPYVSFDSIDTVGSGSASLEEWLSWEKVE